MIRFKLVALVLICSVTLSAGVITIGSTNSGRPFLGSNYDNLRGILSDPAKFGPGGVVTNSVAFASAIGAITAPALAGYQIFFLTEPGALSSGEITALQTAVLAGMALVAVADSGGNSGISSLLAALDGGSMSGVGGGQSSTAAFVAGSGLSTGGPFGAVSGTLGSSALTPTTPGTASTTILTNSGSVLTIEMAPGALGAGSGAVIVMGDVLWMNYFVGAGGGSGGTLYGDTKHAIMASNWIGAVGAVPEPSTFALLGGGIVALFFASRARRKA